MKNNLGNNIFSFMKNSNYTNITSNKNERSFKIPFGLKSSGRSFSNSESNNGILLTEKYNRDLENIRKMQNQGVIRKLTRKDSINLRKNNFLNETHEEVNLI